MYLESPPGIGLGLIKALLARPATTVIASVRSQTAVIRLEAEAANISAGDGSKLYIIILDLAGLTSPHIAREALQNSLARSITHIDVLISNAGIISDMGPSLNSTAEQLHAHFQGNSIAPLMLFQAFWPLMQVSSQPKFIAITSSVGSIEMQEPYSGGSYGASKAALNWITKRLHIEFQKEGLTSVAVHPGWVQTEGGKFAADSWGYDGKPPLTVEQSVESVLRVVDAASRENTSGKFVSYDGQMLAW